MRKTALLLAIAACSDSDSSDGAGTVAFTTWGEEYIEQEIPASSDGETIVEDGWTIRFDKFLIALSDISIAEEGRAPVATMPTPKIFDMHAAGEKPVISFPNLPAKAFAHVSYAISPATAAAELGAGATDADKQLMVTSGYSVYVSATATKDAIAKKFQWGFKTSTLYDKCKGQLSGKEVEGVVVTNGGTDNVQLTIHGDHFFYDDLQSPEAKVRFDALAAADKDNDGAVTLEELAAVRLSDLPANTYGTGTLSEVIDLRGFVEALSRTVGHYRGEGECLARAR